MTIFSPTFLSQFVQKSTRPFHHTALSSYSAQNKAPKSFAACTITPPRPPLNFQTPDGRPKWTSRSSPSSDQTENESSCVAICLHHGDLHHCVGPPVPPINRDGWWWRTTDQFQASCLRMHVAVGSFVWTVIPVFTVGVLIQCGPCCHVLCCV